MMAYFPFFMEMEGTTGLIIGGGKRALHKVKKLLPYGAKLQLVSDQVLDEIKVLENVRITERCFREDDLNPEPDFVVIATEDESENRQIFEMCRKRKIPVNAVDDIEHCSYIFPALILRGDLSVGISTGGAGPAVCGEIKRQLEELLPENIDEILTWLKYLRPALKKRFPNEKTRSDVYRKLYLECAGCNRPLTEEEADRIFDTF